MIRYRKNFIFGELFFLSLIDIYKHKLSDGFISYSTPLLLSLLQNQKGGSHSLAI